jgi:hypothetical protein
MIFGTTGFPPESAPTVEGTGAFSANPIDGDAVLRMLSAYESEARRAHGADASIDQHGFLRMLGYSDEGAVRILKKREFAQLSALTEKVRSWRTRRIPELSLSSTALDAFVLAEYEESVEELMDVLNTEEKFFHSMIKEVMLSLIANETLVFLRAYVLKTKNGRGDNILSSLIQSGGKLCDIRRFIVEF